MGMSRSYASIAEGARGNTNVGGSTMMALHDGMHVPRGSGGSVKVGRKAGLHTRKHRAGVRDQGDGGNTHSNLIRGRASAPERYDQGVLFVRTNGLNSHRTWGLWLSR